MANPRVTFSQASTAVQALCLAWSLIACNDIGTGALYTVPEGVEVSVDQSSMVVVNNTSRTIYIFAAEKRASDEFLDWIQGCDTSNAISPESTREILYTKIPSYFKGCDAYVFWWNCPYDLHLRSMLVKTL